MTGERAWCFAVAPALAALLLGMMTASMFADPDMFHEMALIREALELGHLPLEDRFAYTPTVTPSVHHEWGTGAILYLLATEFGAPGVLTLSYTCVLLTLLVTLATARRRGASWLVLGSIAPVAIVILDSGATVFRAQVFTLAAMAVLIYALERDRDGWRTWIGPWLLLWVLWLNLHGGFVVGLVLLAAHALEQIWRRKPYAHLLFLALAMLALVVVNPYGWTYYTYLATALTMDRPLITEWWPLWRAEPIPIAAFAFAFLIGVYAILRRGSSAAHGIVLLSATAWAAIQHQRHLLLFSVAWLAYVPGLVQGTPLGGTIETFWNSRPQAAKFVWAGVAILSAVMFFVHKPMHLPIPCNPGDHPLITYPVGAVDFLGAKGFQGNLMVPFTAGAYVTWKLHPNVKVSIDGRYEVAYAPGIMERISSFYRGVSDWQDTLRMFPTDAVLVHRTAPVEGLLSSVGWNQVYVDDAFTIYAPHPWTQQLDRTQTVLCGSFP